MSNLLFFFVRPTFRERIALICSSFGSIPEGALKQPYNEFQSKLVPHASKNANAGETKNENAIHTCPWYHYLW